MGRFLCAGGKKGEIAGILLYNGFLRIFLFKLITITLLFIDFSIYFIIDNQESH
jgi:hypothetical protein